MTKALPATEGGGGGISLPTREETPWEDDAASFCASQ